MTLDPRPSDAELLARVQRSRVTSALPAASARSDSQVTTPMRAPTVALGSSEDPRFARMNKTERRYADYLQLLTHAGEVLWWEFEPFSVRLADDAFWRPDFGVMYRDRSLELVDVKGRKGDSFYATEDARLKVRFVAAHYPFRVRVAWESSRDVWQHQTFSPTDSP